MLIKSGELSSISTQLNEISTRIEEMLVDADREDEDVVSLMEIERQLQTICRRLNKLV